MRSIKEFTIEELEDRIAHIKSEGDIMTGIEWERE